MAAPGECCGTCYMAAAFLSASAWHPWLILLVNEGCRPHKSGIAFLPESPARWQQNNHEECGHTDRPEDHEKVGGGKDLRVVGVRKVAFDREIVAKEAAGGGGVDFELDAVECGEDAR